MTQDQYWVGAQLRQVAERVGAFLRFDKLCGGNGSYDGRVLGTDAQIGLCKAHCLMSTVRQAIPPAHLKSGSHVQPLS